MTIAETKKQMTDAFIADTNIVARYELKPGKTFDEQFSSVSVESILFYIVAACVWALSTLFDLHKKEVTDQLSSQKPHRVKWYRDKTLAFQQGYLLPTDSDVYPTIDEVAQVVKYAAVVEPADSSKLLIKIAGDTGGKRDKLPDATALQVASYLHWVKDAGVRFELVNKSPDAYRCAIDIYYNAMLPVDAVRTAVRDTITSHIENLEFNGEYTNMSLMDALQAVEGVVIPDLLSAESKPQGDYAFSLINAKRIPDAGYFRAYSESDITINMKAYELAQD